MSYCGSKFQEKGDPAKMQETTLTLGDNIS